ncbi:MAG: TonB-dependent receptor domain-containing protein [Terriglobia bacterium]
MAVPEQLPCLTLDNPVTPTQLLGLNLTANRTDGRPCGDPVGLALVDLYPLPQSGFTFTGAPQVPVDQHSFDIRIDQRLGDNDNLYGTFSFFDNEAIIERGAFENPLAPGGFSAVADVRSYHNSISWVHTFSPTVLNTARFGFNLVRSVSSPLAPAGNAGPDFGLTGLPGTFAHGLPPIVISGYEILGTNRWRPQFANSQVWQVIDNLSYIRGRHTFKFGFEYKRAINNFLDIRAPNGEISIPSSPFYAKDGIANLLLGNVSDTRATSPLVPHRYVDGTMFYAQDSWRVTPALTVNYGVRYEYFTPWIERDRLTTSFDPEGAGGRGVLLTTFPGTLPATTQCTFQCLVQVTGGGIFGKTLVDPDRNNIAPRFGFAWSPEERFVLRGGAAIFYQAIDRFGSSANLALNPPQFFENRVRQRNADGAPVFQLRDGFPNITAPPADLGDPTSIFIRGQDPDSVTPYSIQWSFGPQIEIFRDLALDIAYVGQKSNHLRRLLDISQGTLVSPGVVVDPFPDWGTVGDYLRTIGSSNYHSLQINARKRFSHGLMFNAAYTWGKALGDTGSNLSGGSTSSQVNPQNINDLDADYGPLNFDQTHRFVANWQYELPFGPQQPYLNEGLAAKLLGDWQFNGIWTSTSGVPITITASDATGTGSANARANCLATPNGPRAFEQWNGMFPGSPFFAQPTSGFGTCSNGTLRGWPHHRGDVSLFKKFRFTENRWVEMRFEFFNVFNTPQFGRIRNSVNSPTFVQTRELEDPDRLARVIQLGVKIYF